MPSKDTKIERLRPKTNEVYWVYYLKMYERNLKISDVTSIGLPVLIRVLEAGLPEGVLLDIKKFHIQDLKSRYVPDKQLLELKQEYEKQR
jgi:large subunit ribosomal protein L48